MKNTFYYNDMALEVPDSVYFPREDSLLLAEVLEKEQPRNALDMGCGTGFLSILLAKKCSVTAVDANPEAIRTTEKNAAMNGVTLTTIESDLFQIIQDKFELVVFNPPYLTTEAPRDLQWSGGIELVERFLKEAKTHLTENGKILLLVSTLTGEAIALFDRLDYKHRVVAQRKLPWEQLIVFELTLK